MNYTADDVQKWRDEEAAKRYSREWLIWLCDQALKAMTPQPEVEESLKMSREVAEKVYSMAIRPQDTWTAFEQAMVHGFALLHASRVITKAEAFASSSGPQYGSTK
jgi:hypothetical protein